MSHPPQPPPPPQGWGPPTGPPSGPPGFPPQGPPGQYGAPYGGGYGGPPKKSNTGLVVGLVILAVVLLVGIAVTAVLVVRASDDEPVAGRDPSASTSSSPTAASPSTPPAPTDASSATTPATPYSPTDDTGDDVHADVKASDFPGDWNFKLGDVEHDATLLDQWDYDGCGPVEEGVVLTNQRCEYAVQWTYSALGGRARLTHIFLVFDTERHAKAAEAKISDKDFDLRKESVFPDYVQGRFNTSVYGNILGVTVGTTKVTVSDKRLQSLVNYMNTDYRLALTFKQL